MTQPTTAHRLAQDAALLAARFAARRDDHAKQATHYARHDSRVVDSPNAAYRHAVAACRAALAAGRFGLPVGDAQ